MQETDVTKAVITAINVIILILLPIMAAWHICRIKKFEHASYDWWMQILVVLSYGAAINAEIPALWSRWKSYYVWHIQIPEAAYTLTTWDRWSHALYYILFMFITWALTKKRVPSIITETIG
jgi:hypothetical protein